MSKFDKIYGGRWMKAVDLDGQRRQMQIEDATWEKVGKEQEDKLVLKFMEQDKRFILNATNARRLAEQYGKNEVGWPGKWVEAVQVETAFGPGVQITPIEVSADVAASADVPW